MTAQASIVSALKRFGRPMVLRRVAGCDEADLDVTVFGTASLAPAAPSEGITQALGTVTISNAEIAGAGWPGPPRAGDRLVIDGRAVTIQGPVDTKYLGSSVLVHICMVKG
jgi:hypothetical protein